MKTPHFFSACIQQIRLECSDTVSLDLVALAGQQLPAFAAGAHIDVQLPGGLLRSYSLFNAPPLLGTPVNRYRIAVKREPGSRGGSAWFHTQARVGQQLQVCLPANAFVLTEVAPQSLFITGGIGITPALAMIARLQQLGRPWRLCHTVRDGADQAFASELAQLASDAPGAVLCHASASAGRMDIAGLVAQAGAASHLYCCGPNGMIDAFIAATRERQDISAHHERFAASQAAAADGGYTLELARDGRRLDVPAGRSILDVLLDAGIDMQYACTQGVCGTCKVGVLGGIPDHRDDCLSEQERAGNRAIIACCSGARSEVLVLDL